MKLTICPECGTLAEVLAQGSFYSTDGVFLDHVAVHCLEGHWLFGLAEDLVAS